MHKALGNIFAITMPGFKPVVLSGQAAAHELLVTNRDKFNWRVEKDPVTRLLRHGLLVEDGEFHDRLRSYMQPALKRSEIDEYLPLMLQYCDEVISSWDEYSEVDMLIEMRKLALLILMRTLFSVDISGDLQDLWGSILRILKYISPGLWIVNPDLPRPGFQAAINTIDDYLYAIIRERRLNNQGYDDMLSDLISKEDMDDDLIRDQMLTMLIAGHDTSTALTAWMLYLLSVHPEIKVKAQDEVNTVLGDDLPSPEKIGRLHYIEQIIKETLRLYPPIHAANRETNSDLNLQGCPVGRGRRVMFSYYLTHRDEQVWDEPERFDPQRFERGKPRTYDSFSYLPFGGGPRNCIGAAFAQNEAKIILARILQRVDFEPTDSKIKIHMGATLEPRPGVMLRIFHRSSSVEHSTQTQSENQYTGNSSV